MKKLILFIALGSILTACTKDDSSSTTQATAPTPPGAGKAGGGGKPGGVGDFDLDK